MNEGLADFCAKLFIEDLYGEEAYKALVRSNHYTVVATAHLRDGGWYALADVPQNMTYGETSYKKGSDIARTLRATLGDSLFSAGMKQVFSRNAYTSMSSAALRDSLCCGHGHGPHRFFQRLDLPARRRGLHGGFLFRGAERGPVRHAGPHPAEDTRWGELLPPCAGDIDLHRCRR
ncbi:MAG: hypothetical protein IPI95_06150 [Flavobacteriales bacterium]|nr:hypothetical protein [Flavobacteriales bacterium]